MSINKKLTIKYLIGILAVLIVMIALAVVGQHNYRQSQERERQLAITHVVPGSILQVKAKDDNRRVIDQKYYVFMKKSHAVIRCNDLRDARRAQIGQDVIGTKRYTYKITHKLPNEDHSEVNAVTVWDHDQIVMRVFFDDWYGDHQKMSINDSVGLEPYLNQLGVQHHVDPITIDLGGHLITR